MKSGVVFIEKPAGITSFKSLDIIKKRLGTKKIGHTGTLDKFASGVMIVLTGGMTKLADYFSGMDKEYEAVFTFGKETNTLDSEGRIIKTADLPELSTIKKNIFSLTGEILQSPPDFSAVHVKGKRAYQLALAGDKPVMNPRKIMIYDFSIIDWKPPLLSVYIKCSKGTYIRSLARDLGRMCNSCAYVSSLKRIKVGKIDVENAVSPEIFSPDKHLVKERDVFKFLPEIQTVTIKKEYVSSVKNGKKLKIEWLDNPDFTFNYFALFDENTFIALVRKINDNLSYIFVSGELQ